MSSSCLTIYKLDVSLMLSLADRDEVEPDHSMGILTQSGTW